MARRINDRQRNSIRLRRAARRRRRKQKDRREEKPAQGNRRAPARIPTVPIRGPDTPEAPETPDTPEAPEAPEAPEVEALPEDPPGLPGHGDPLHSGLPPLAEVLWEFALPLLGDDPDAVDDVELWARIGVAVAAWNAAVDGGGWVDAEDIEEICEEVAVTWGVETQATRPVVAYLVSQKETYWSEDLRSVLAHQVVRDEEGHVMLRVEAF